MSGEWFKVRYSHGQTDVVPKSEIDKILKSGKKVFEVVPIERKSDGADAE